VNDLKDECFGSGFDSRHLHQLTLRNNMKNILATCVIALIMIPTIATTSSYERHVNILGQWKKTPGVVLCDENSVSRDQIEKGLEWWKERGHAFQLFSIEDNQRFKDICENVWGSYPSGYIVIAKMTPDVIRGPKDIAITYVSPDEYTGGLRWAKMFFQEDEFVDRLVEHELGHALGYDHLEERGHMMHPYMHKGGWHDAALNR